MTADMTAESIALGLATAWNPIAIGANLGFELLTSTPLWFGGGYVFGVALRPVRVEARLKPELSKLSRDIPSGRQWISRPMPGEH
jgi:hypothetical protein